MTEADLEREAVKLFQHLGLKVGAESLDFFKGESLYIKDWKKSFKHPHATKSGIEMSSCLSPTTRLSSNPHYRRTQPLVINPNASDIGSEGSPNISPATSSNENTDREDEGDEEYFGKQ